MRYNKRIKKKKNFPDERDNDLLLLFFLIKSNIGWILPFHLHTIYKKKKKKLSHKITFQFSS